MHVVLLAAVRVGSALGCCHIATETSLLQLEEDGICVLRARCDARVMAWVLDITPRLGKEAGPVKLAEAKATGVKMKAASKANGKVPGKAKIGK